MVAIDDPFEDYGSRDAGVPTQLNNTHPDATATWLLLVMRGIDSGLSLSKDSAIELMQKYLSHYIKVLAHVHVECRLSRGEELRLLTLCSCCEPRVAFLQQDATWKALEAGSAVTPPSFDLKISSTETVFKQLDSSGGSKTAPKRRPRFMAEDDGQGSQFTLW